MSKKDKDVRELDCGTKVTFFNLKKALRGDDVVCRNGSGVSQLINFDLGDNGSDSLYGVADEDNEVTMWNCDGKFNCLSDESDWDLFMVYKEKPKKDKKVKNKDNKKTKRWVNIYQDMDNFFDKSYEASSCFDSKKEAKENIPDYTKKDGSYIKTIKIKF